MQATFKRNINNIFENGTVPIKTYKRKNYFDLGSDMKKRIQRNVIDHLTSNLALNQQLKEYGIRVNQIEFVKISTDPEQKHSNNYKNISVNAFNKTAEEIDKEYKKTLEKICMAKDICYISDANYMIFKIVTQLSLPTIHFIRKQRQDLNKKLPEIYKNNFGVFFDAGEKIKWILESKINEMSFNSDQINICLRGDKTNVGRNMSLFNFCFAITDENELARTASGNYTLGIFEVIKDDYPTMSIALREISDSLRALDNKILFKNKELKINWDLAGDMVWHKCERGLNSCGSNYPCFACGLNKNEFYKFNNQNVNDCLRSNAESESILSDKNKKEKIGYVTKPIFDFIDFKRLHHDPLHELIRIVETLLNLTHHKLIRLDEIKSNDLNKLPGQKKLIDFLTNIVGIKNPYNPKGQKSKDTDPNINLKQIRGDDAVKIAMNLTVDVLAGLKEAEKITLLFNNYYRIHLGYTHNFYRDKLELLQKRLNDWKILFNEVFAEKHNTPYIHYFTDHLSHDIAAFGDLGVYTMQGLEKLNDLTTKQFFGATSRKDGYMKQLLQKRTRLEHYRLNVLNPIIESERSRERKLKNKAFFNRNDLYEIQNLKTIASVIHGKETEEDESLPTEFVNQLEQNLIEIIDEEINDDNDQKEDKELINNQSKKFKIDFHEEFKDNYSNKRENQHYSTNLNDNQNINQKACSSTMQELAESQLEEEIVKNDLNDLILYQIDDCLLKRKDIECLLDQNWLNDTCILAFMKSLNTNNKILILNPIQTSKFLVNKSIKDSEIFPKKYSGCDYIAGPVHTVIKSNSSQNAGHWTLLFVSLLEKKIYYIDSSGTLKDAFDNITNNFKNFAKSSKTLKKYQFESNFVNHQTQNDTFNCGVFVCHFFETLINQKSFDLFIDINNYRHNILRELKNKNKMTICCLCHKKKSNNFFSLVSSKTFKTLACSHAYHNACLKNESCLACDEINSLNIMI